MTDIEITQADREAAATYFGYPRYSDLVLASERRRVDELSLVLALHRTQARIAALEEAARVAEGRKAYWGHHPNFTPAADDIATAIRNLTKGEQA